jgi:hypothetical protein
VDDGVELASGREGGAASTGEAGAPDEVDEVYLGGVAVSTRAGWGGISTPMLGEGDRLL